MNRQQQTAVIDALAKAGRGIREQDAVEAINLAATHHELLPVLLAALRAHVSEVWKRLL